MPYPELINLLAVLARDLQDPPLHEGHASDDLNEAPAIVGKPVNNFGLLKSRCGAVANVHKVVFPSFALHVFISPRPAAPHGLGSRSLPWTGFGHFERQVLRL